MASYSKSLTNIKLNVLRIIKDSKSSHIGSNFSCAHILLFFYKNYIFKKKNFLILSKGHAAAVYYSVLHEFKRISIKKLMSFSKNNSFLSGHISEYVNRDIHYSSGSLGNGVGVGCGMAYLSKLKKDKKKTFIIISDGDLNEGSTWEAFLFASHHNFKNLIIIYDSNKLQNIEKTKNVIDIKNLKKKIQSFNFDFLNINGHSFKELEKVKKKINNQMRPVFINANTIKGKGVSFMENKILWHYKNPNDQEFIQAEKEINNER